MAPRLRCLSTVYGPGCLPGHRDYLTRHDSPGFDAGRLLRPLVPRERSRSLARPPSAVSDVHIARHRTHGASGSTRPRRPSVERHGASVPTRVHLPPQLRNTRVSRKLRFGTWASPSTSYGGAPAPDFHRPSGLTSLSGWLPTTLPQGSSHMAATIAPAPKRHHTNLVITLAAAALRAALAPRHYRIAACSAGTPHRECDVPRRGRPAVTGRCASTRPRALAGRATRGAHRTGRKPAQGADPAHDGLGPDRAKPTARAAPGIAAHAPPVRAAGGDRTGRRRARRMVGAHPPRPCGERRAGGRARCGAHLSCRGSFAGCGIPVKVRDADMGVPGARAPDSPYGGIADGHDGTVAQGLDGCHRRCAGLGDGSRGRFAMGVDKRR